MSLLRSQGKGDLLAFFGDEPRRARSRDPSTPCESSRRAARSDRSQGERCKVSAEFPDQDSQGSRLTFQRRCCRDREAGNDIHAPMEEPHGTAEVTTLHLDAR